jgi:hypothetical protein
VNPLSGHGDLPGSLFSLHSLVAILLTSLFIWLAARFVLDRSSILAAIASAVISTLLAGVVVALVGGTLGIILGVLVWALCTSAFFRTDWIKGAIIGLVAWVLYYLTGLLLGALD